MAGILLWASPGTAFSPPSLLEKTSPVPRNILLITLDTTRADHLSCYGYALLTTPNLDALASRGVRFTRASAVIPLTGPGHATILTGLLPRDHGAIRNGVPTRKHVPNLATVLRARGFRTAAFVSGWTLQAKLTHLDRGFRVYDDKLTDRYQLVNSQRPANETVDRAVAWLAKNAGAPFFLWLHLFDPHAPYTDHHLKIPLNPSGRGVPPSSGDPSDYAQEIAFADHQIGRVLGALDRAGLRGSTLILVVSDHGESFGEHGENGHGRELYETTQHIPLILVSPSLSGGEVSDLPVSTVDVAPTILDLLHLPPLPDAAGISLDRALRQPEPFASRNILEETYRGARKTFWRIFSPGVSGQPIQVAIRQGEWKAILDLRSDEIALFNLDWDPEEATDLSHLETGPLGKLQPALRAHANKKWHGRDGDQPRMSEKDLRRLESLGYVE
ncbi:MAG: sulfatase [Acidobacteriota bacterium]